MVFKLVGTFLLLVTLSWSSVFCPDNIRAKVAAAVTIEPITQGESLRGFRIFINNSVDGAKIVIYPAGITTNWITSWDDYVELLYILSKDTPPNEKLTLKVLFGGRTYICNVNIYYNFYTGFVKEVE